MSTLLDRIGAMILRGQTPVLDVGNGRRELAVSIVRTLADFDTVGVEIVATGRSLVLNPSSHGAAVLEVCFGEKAGQAERWVALTTSSRARRADGTPFDRFFVRRLSTTPSDTSRVAIDVDPDELGSIQHLPRTPNVGPEGAADLLLRLRRSSDDTLGDAEAANGTAAGRAVLAVAGYVSGTTYARLGAIGAALSDAIANPGAANDGVLKAAAFGLAWNGATWSRVRGLAAAFSDGAITDAPAGALHTLAQLAVRDAGGATLFGLRGIQSNGDSFGGLTTASNLATFAYNYVFRDGSGSAPGTWDRLAATADNADTVAAAAVGRLLTIARGTLFNGTTWDRARSEPGAPTAGTARVVEATPATVNHGQISVDSTAGGTLIRAADAGRKALVLHNEGTTTVWVGNTGLTTATGFPVLAGEKFTCEAGVAVYGIRAGAAEDVAYWEET